MSPIKFIIIAALFFAWPAVVLAQHPDFVSCSKEFLCEDYKTILDRTIHFIDEENGEAAFTELKALEACDKCPEHRDAIEELSNEIIGIFKKKNDDLEAAKAEQEAILAKLKIEKANVALQRDRQEVLRKQSGRLAKEASIDNYISQAQDYYDRSEYEKAYWLTDFVYNYIDSSHHEVKKMLYKLYNQKFIPDDSFVAYDPYDDGFEEGALENTVEAVEWSNDKKWLAVGMFNSQFVIFDELGKPQVEYKFFDFEVSITDVSFNQTSNILAISFSNGTVYFWELDEEGTWAQSNSEIYPDIVLGVRVVSWSPTNANQLVYGSDDGTIRLYDYQNAVNEVAFSLVHVDWVRDIAWSPEGDRFVSGSDDGTAIIWSIAQEAPLHILEGHIDFVRTVDWHPYGHEIITGSDDRLLITWDTLGNPIDSTYQEGWIYQARYSDNGDRIGLIVNQSAFCILEGEDQLCGNVFPNIYLFDWKGETNTIGTVDWGNETPLLFENEENKGYPFIIPNFEEDNESEEMPMDTGIEEGNILSLEWSPDGNFLAYSKANSLVVISEDSVKQVNLGFESITGLSWSPGLSSVLPNSNLLVTIDDYYHVRVWDAIDLTLLGTLTFTEQLLSIDWSSDGTTLACGMTTGKVQLITWKDGVLEAQQGIGLHNDYVRSVAWSPNGRLLASASDDLTTVIYDPEKDVIVKRLEGHSDWVRSVCWLSDTRLATAGDDQKTIIWENKDDKGFKLNKSLNKEEGVGFHMQVAYTGNEKTGILSTLAGGTQFILWYIDIENDSVFITKETIIDVKEANCISWHPTSKGISFGQYGSYPQSLSSYNNYTKELAYEADEKPYSISVLGDINSVQLNNPFFNEKIKITPSRFDDIQWSADEKLIASISPYDNEEINVATIYDVTTGEELYTVKNESDIKAIRFSPDNKYLADAHLVGFVVIRNAIDGQDSVLVSEGGTFLVEDLLWSPNSRYLVFLDEADQLTIWDHQNKKLKYKLDCPPGVFKIMFHPNDSDRLLLLNSENIFLLDFNQIGKGFTSLFQVKNGLNTNMQWVDNNQHLLLSQTNKQAIYFSYQNRQLSAKRNLSFKEDLFSPVSAKGSLLCSYSLLDTMLYEFKRDDREIVNIRDLHTLQPLGGIHDTRNRLVTDMVISPNDQLLATLGFSLFVDQGRYFKGNARVDIWDVAKKKSLYELDLWGVEKIDFSPQGNYLVIYKYNGEIVFLPLNLPEIQQFLLKEDKDQYFRQLDNQSKDIKPIQDFIEQCGLAKGLFLDLDDNIEKTAQREEFSVRKGWAQYLMEQAWFQSNDEAADYFAWSTSLHQEGRSKKTKPNLQDSVALSDIYFDQTLYYLRLGQAKVMNQSLQKAINLASNSSRIQFFYVLLDWHQGRKQKAFDKILAYQSEDDHRLLGQLQDEYLLWQRKGIELNDDVMFFRLLSNDRQLFRYTNANIDILESPTMSELVAEFNKESQKKYLTTYYSSNQYHENLQSNERRYEFLSQAVQFLEDNYDENNFESEIIKNYATYLYEMMGILVRENQIDEAIALSEKAAAASRLWMEDQPDNQEAIEQYQVIFSEFSILELVQGRDPNEIKGRLMTALEKSDKVTTPMLGIRIAHCELMLGNTKEAYSWYNNIMDDLNFVESEDEGIQALEFISGETEQFIPEQTETLRTNLGHLNEINFYIKNSKASSDEVLASKASEDLTALSGQKNDAMQYWLDKATQMHDEDVIADSTLQYIQNEVAVAKAKHAYNLLLLATREKGEELVKQTAVIQNLLDESMLINNEITWVKAVVVLNEMLQNDSKGATKAMESIKDFYSLFPSKENQTIIDFLRHPPSEIKSHPNYTKLQKKLDEWGY